jgi:hypothetical protein
VDGTKNYKVGFFVGKVGSDGKVGKVSAILKKLAGQKKHLIHGAGARTDKYEIRHLESFNDGASFTGVFAKIRLSDLPHIGEAGGPERELELAEKEGLIEKNHFLYFRRYEMLVYQANRNGGSEQRMAEYLSSSANETISFDPVLQPEPMKRLMRNELKITSLEVSFARPTNADWYPKDQFGKDLMGLLHGAEGARLHLSVHANGYGRRTKQHHLRDALKRTMREIVNHADTRVARVMVDDDDHEHPIDLIADRIRDSVVVPMNGRYPVTEKMFNALREVHDAQGHNFRDIFGDGHKKID